MVGIPTYSSGNDKKCLMSREKRPSGGSLESTILALKNETIWSGFLWYLAAPSGQHNVHYVASSANPLKAVRF